MPPHQHPGSGAPHPVHMPSVGAVESAHQQRGVQPHQPGSAGHPQYPQGSEHMHPQHMQVTHLARMFSAAKACAPDRRLVTSGL